MTTKNVIAKWGEGCYLTTETCSSGKSRFVGIYTMNCCKFRFSVVCQNNSKYKYRGNIRAIDEFGESIMVKGKKIEENIYVHDGEEEEIRNVIVEKATKLLSEHAKAILYNMEKTYRPDMITPILAATFKAREYAEFKHQGCQKRSIDDAEKRIKRICANLPLKPMHQITKKEMRACVNLHGVGHRAINELHDFWKYTIDNGICIKHTNPVEKVRKKSSRGEKKIKELLKKVQLDLSEMDTVFDELEKINNGVAMGSALLLSAVPTKNIEQVVWEDIIFLEEGKADFAVIKIYMPKRKGATHNFSRPLLPRSAELLYKKYKELSSIYGEETVKGFPVVAQKTDVTKKAKLDQVYALTEQLMVQAEIVETKDMVAIKKLDLQMSSIRRICITTYKAMLKTICNLEEESMEYKFLCGLALGGDTTVDNYTAMCSRLGWEHMYTSMAPLRKKTINNDNFINTKQKNIAVPENSRELTKVSAKIIIAPGEEIAIHCKHGVGGIAKVVAIKH